MKLIDYARLMGIDLVPVEGQPSIDDLRIVEMVEPMLESLDEDSPIMDVPLRLSESCIFSFDRHMDAIVESENTAQRDHKERYTQLNMAQQNSKEYDRRYKERAANRIRIKG